MKIHLFSLGLFCSMICNTLPAQTHLPFSTHKKHALTASPWQAFTDRGELQFGYEKQNSRLTALELNVGFRFKGSSDPQFAPYSTNELVRSGFHEVRKGVMFFFFIPIPVWDRDKDWTKKNTYTENYVTHHVFASAAYKCYILPFRQSKVAGGVYLAPNLTLGNRGIASYTYTDGQSGKVTQITSEFLPNGQLHPAAVFFGTGFIGSRKVVQEDVYEFSSLEKKTYSKTYLHPGVRAGVQVPIANTLAIDFGGQMTIVQAPIGRVKGSPFRFEPVVRASVWF